MYGETFYEEILFSVKKSKMSEQKIMKNDKERIKNKRSH
jgi:hypothetical protein